jgi:nitroreductase
MDILHVIKARRSVRHFKPDPIPKEVITTLLEAARHAPSAGNLQPWRFYVIWRDEVRSALAGAAFRQQFVAEAPVVIAVVAIPEASGLRYGQRGRELYCLQDTGAAVQNILLTATALGLGTCWVGAFDDETVRRVLKLPPTERPVALIPIGYPASKAVTTSRKPLAEITSMIN